MECNPAVYLHLDPHSGEPIYRQLVEQVKYRVACGRLKSGDQLPSIRALAADLKINPRTVVKAYDELEHAGLVVSRPGQGVFIADRRDEIPKALRRRELEKLARRLVAEAARLGAGKDELMGIIEKAVKETESKQ